VCNLGFCRTPVGLGEACGPAAPCQAGLSCDPLAGFRCVGTAGVDEACGPLVSCDPGLQCTLALRCSHDPALAGETCDLSAPCADGLFCALGLPQRCEARADLGDACGPAKPCLAGLACDPLAGFRCVDAAGPGEACGPLVLCEDALVCTASFRCAHDPGLAGETCDFVNQCAGGLFCRPDSPTLVGRLLQGHCEAYRRLGESCTPPAIDPDQIGSRCLPGTSCEPCFVERCENPFQCFRNGNQGVITEVECRALYSEGLRQAAVDSGLAMTYGGGQGAAAVASESLEFGTAYGPDGRYGCYTQTCFGIEADVSAEAFAALGFQNTFDDVGGSSFATTQEAQTPFSLISFSTSQIFARDGPQDLTPGELVGTADAFAIGGGLSPAPFSAGSYLCETLVDEIDPEEIPEPPAGLLAATAFAALAALAARRRPGSSR
jgi:hypothetical protein